MFCVSPLKLDQKNLVILSDGSSCFNFRLPQARYADCIAEGGLDANCCSEVIQANIQVCPFVVLDNYLYEFDFVLRMLLKTQKYTLLLLL